MGTRELMIADKFRVFGRGKRNESVKRGSGLSFCVVVVTTLCEDISFYG